MAHYVSDAAFDSQPPYHDAARSVAVPHMLQECSQARVEHVRTPHEVILLCLDYMPAPWLGHTTLLVAPEAANTADYNPSSRELGHNWLLDIAALVGWTQSLLNHSLVWLSCKVVRIDRTLQLLSL